MPRVLHLPVHLDHAAANRDATEQAKEARKKADDALKQAKATKSYEEFGLLAEKISEDDYRVNMGDHKVSPQQTSCHRRSSRRSRR